MIFAAPLVVSGLGFSSSGIIGGTAASSMMSTTAPTAAGGVVATFQSIGAAGLGSTGTATMGTVGSFIGAGVGIVTDTLLKCD